MISLTVVAIDALRSARFKASPTERLKLFRTLFALERANARGASTGEVEVEMLGHPMRGFRAESMHFLFDEIFMKTQYDFETSTPEPVIVDCGANIGVSVLSFKLKHPGARIIAFEANPHAFRMLRTNVANNNLDHVDLRQAAVYDVEGQIPFFINDDPGSLESSTQPARGGEQRIMVACERLSQTLGPLQRVDLVKIDVEGAEWAILDDLLRSGLLAKPVRYIIEYHHQMVGEAPRLSRFLAPFEEAGYRYNIASRINRPNEFQDVLVHLTRE